MNVLDFENGMPKQLLLSGCELDRIIMIALERALPQFGRLMPIDKIEEQSILGKKVYVITLESEDGCQ